MEWGEDGKVFIFDRNDLGKPLTPSTRREEIKPGHVCGVAKTWQPYFREKSKEELGRVFKRVFREKSNAELDRVLKGTTFCVYTRKGKVALPQEAITICSRADVGANTSNYRNAFHWSPGRVPRTLQVVGSHRQERST